MNPMSLAKGTIRAAFGEGEPGMNPRRQAETAPTAGDGPRGSRREGDGGNKKTPKANKYNPPPPERRWLMIRRQLAMLIMHAMLMKSNHNDKRTTQQHALRQTMEKLLKVVLT